MTMEGMAPEDILRMEQENEMIDKEAQEKIKDIITTAECLGRHSADIVWQEGREEATEDYINQILQALTELGYCKLPKDKPPLLNGEEILKRLTSGGDKLWKRIANHNPERFVQWEADIKHYEG